MELIDTKERFIEMRAKGYSFDKIALELGKAKQTLIDWSKELQDEIANRKALELEALYETGEEVIFPDLGKALQTLGVSRYVLYSKIQSREVIDGWVISEVI